MRKIFFYTVLVVICTTSLTAQQFDINGELRPRYEYRHGFKTLSPTDAEAASFVSQRARISMNYSSEKYKVFFSLQNVRVWGDVSTLSNNDKFGVTFHEAWGEYYFNPKLSIKLGRQEISLDDQRIFGAVNWVQQARSHDALIVKYKTGEKSKLNLGFALSANGESLFQEDYLINQYKNFQYAWFHTDFSENMGLSLLLLNNGMPYNFADENQKIAYSQTLGGRLTYSKNRFIADAASYIQAGETPINANSNKTDLTTYYFTLNAKFKFTSTFLAGAGVEILSGNDMGGSSSKDKAFKPLYGTNHKFNGWMDYFYVGSFMNSVGLIDINTPLIYKKNKFSAILIPHFFSADGMVLDNNLNQADSYLGTEIDLNLGYKIYKNISFNIGYSHMFATDTMEILKGGSKDQTNNWAWAMITFKPNFFSKNLSN